MKRQIGIFALIAVQIISGINNPVIHFALQSMPIYLFGFLRVGIAFIIIGPVALARRQLRPAKKKFERRDLLMAIVGSLLVYCGSNLAFYEGVHRSSSINASIIGLLGPLLFFMVALEVFKEKFNAKIFLGVGLAFIGALVIVIGPLAGHASDSVVTGVSGNLFLIVSVLTEVAGTIILKKALKHMHVLDVLAVGLLVATLVYGWLAVPQLASLNLLSVPAIRNAVLYGSIMLGCVGYSLGYFGLSATKGSDFSIIGYLQPAVAMLVAAEFFHESFTPSLIIGGSIVFLGLYLVEARNLVHFHASAIHAK